MRYLIINGTHLASKQSDRLIKLTKEAISGDYQIDEPDVINVQLEDDAGLTYEIFTEVVQNSKRFETKIRQKFVIPKHIIWLIPEYNGSIPAFTKALIDKLGGEMNLKGCVSTIVGYSGGMKGNQIGISHLSEVLHHCKVITNPRHTIISDTRDKSDEYIKTEFKKSLDVFDFFKNFKGV